MNNSARTIQLLDMHQYSIITNTHRFQCEEYLYKNILWSILTFHNSFIKVI